MLSGPSDRETKKWRLKPLVRACYASNLTARSYFEHSDHRDENY
jgi:hypothetical protein